MRCLVSWLFVVYVCPTPFVCEQDIKNKNQLWMDLDEIIWVDRECNKDELIKF